MSGSPFPDEIGIGCLIFILVPARPDYIGTGEYIHLLLTLNHGTVALKGLLYLSLK